MSCLLAKLNSTLFFFPLLIISGIMAVGIAWIFTAQKAELVVQDTRFYVFFDCDIFRGGFCFLLFLYFFFF